MDISGVLPASPASPFPVWVWSGELDSADVAALTSTWQTLLQDHPPAVAIDLSGVTFLDCGVLSVLIHANRVPGTLLTLLAVPPVVHRLFQLTGLSTFFAAAASRDHREPLGLPDLPNLLSLSSHGESDWHRGGLEGGEQP